MGFSKILFFPSSFEAVRGLEKKSSTKHMARSGRKRSDQALYEFFECSAVTVEVILQWLRGFLQGPPKDVGHPLCHKRDPYHSHTSYGILDWEWYGWLGVPRALPWLVTTY